MVDPGVGGGDADRQHRRRHRVAGGRPARQRAGQPILANPRRVRHQHGQHDRGPGRGRGQADAGGRQPEQIGVEGRQAAAGPPQELPRRQRESRDHRHRAGDPGGQRRGAAQPAADQRAVVQRRAAEPRRAAPAVLDRLQQRDGDQQQRPHRQRDAYAAEPEPAAKDADRQGIDPQVVRGAELAERFHRRQHHAGGQGRPGRGEHRAGERLRAGASQAAGHLQQGRALLGEGRARGEVDVRIEERREHERQPAEAAHPQGRIGAGRHAQHLPEQQLRRPRVVEDAAVGQRADVGRDGQRQHQEPPERPPPGEIVYGHQPCGGHADQRAERGDQGDQGGGGARVARQHRAQQVTHLRREDAAQVGDHDQERRADQHAGRDRRRQPAA